MKYCCIRLGNWCFQYVLHYFLKWIFCLFGRQSSDLNKATPPEQPKKGTNLECDRKESGRLHQSHVLQHGQSAQLCTPQLPGANKLCLKNAFGFKMLHCNRRGSKCLIFTQHVKEPFLLYLKPQENPSSTDRNIKKASMIMWTPIFCCSKWACLQRAVEGLFVVHRFIFECHQP